MISVADIQKKVKGNFKTFLNFYMTSLEGGGSGSMGKNLFATQLKVIDHINQFPQCIINKPRQAGISSLCLAWLLWQSMYSKGGKGSLLIANKDATNAELWDRLRHGYDSLPPYLQVPSAQSSAKQLSFKLKGHTGKIKVATAKGKDPALGFSLDCLVASEFGFWQNAEDTWTKLQGTYAKRSHFRGIIESTPGPQGSAYHRMWLDALAGKSTWKPVFLCWLDYPEYTAPYDGSPITNEEISYCEKYNRDPEKHIGHIMFRRKATSNMTYADPYSRFDWQYPPDEYTGWLSGGVPALPQEKIKALQLSNDARSDSPIGSAWEQCQPDTKYIICADPGGWSADGDPSAYTIISLYERREIGAWSGQIDPIQFAEKLMLLGKSYNNAEIICESNNPACIVHLATQGYRNLYTDNNKTHPGYYRGAVNKSYAQNALSYCLSNDMLTIRSKEGLAQLAGWTGTYDRQSGHHWDRLVTYEMAADIIQRRQIPVFQVKQQQKQQRFSQRRQPEYNLGGLI